MALLPFSWKTSTRKKKCEIKTFLIIHEFSRIFYDIRNKTKKILTGFGDAKSWNKFWISSYMIKNLYFNDILLFKQSIIQDGKNEFIIIKSREFKILTSVSRGVPGSWQSRPSWLWREVCLGCRLWGRFPWVPGKLSARGLPFFQCCREPEIKRKTIVNYYSSLVT